MLAEAGPGPLAYLNHNKLCRPPLRRSVQRPRLLRLLSALFHRRLALLHAEAGYGKTTLILDFLARWPYPAIWYRLDRTDRDVTQFVAYLAEGIAQRFPDFGPELRRRLAGGVDADASADLPQLLLHEVSKFVAGPLLIVLDNFEAVAPSDGVCKLVSDLLEYSGPDMHLAIASRTMPPLPIARQLARQEAVLVGDQDLTLTPEETRELLRALPSVNATDAQLELLWKRTEGWAAGLVMVAEALRRSPADHVVANLEELHGPPDMVYQYFANEVFEEQSEPVQQFLLKTSILRRLTRESVNHLLQIDNGGELMAALRGGGIFALGVEAGGADLRYHPLFRAFLRRKLQARYGDDLLRDLNRRAAELSCQQQEWGDAVDYYAAAQDWERAAEIVEGKGEELIRRGLLQTLRHWLELVPEEQILLRPMLLHLRGSLLRLSGRYQAALRDLEGALRSWREQGEWTATVRTQLEIAQCYHRIGEFQKVEATLGDVVASSDDDRALSARVLAELSENSIDTDNLGQACRWAERAVAEVAMADLGVVATISLVRALRFHSRARLLQGELRDSLQLALRSMELARREDMGDFERAWSSFNLGQVFTLRGDFDQALQAFRQAENLSRGDQRQLRRISTWRGVVYRETGAFDLAERDLQRAGRSYGFAGNVAEREMAFLRLRQGRSAEALRLAEDALRSPSGEESLGEKTGCKVVYSLALAAAQERQLGLEQLESAEEILQRRGRRQQLASVQWHAARLLMEEGRHADALEKLEEATAWGAEQGIYHLWWWDPETVARLIPVALTAELNPGYLLELARLRLRPQDCRFLYPALEEVRPDLRRPLAETLRLVSRGSAVHNVAADLLQSCADPAVRRHVGEALASGRLGPEDLPSLRGEAGLTWKEIEVLILYYLQPSGSEPEGRFRHRLAETLGVSEETLKVHIRNIRRKLDLPDRRRDGRMPASLMLRRFL